MDPFLESGRPVGHIFLIPAFMLLDMLNQGFHMRILWEMFFLYFNAEFLFDEIDQAELAQGIQCDIEFQVIDRVSEKRWLRCTCQGFFDDQRNIIEYQSTGEDITDRVILDEQLAHYRENLEELVVERTHQERR